MIKIAVFEDNALLREQLIALLSQVDDGLQCVGGWENCLQVEKIMDFYQPDLVLMDIDMPEADGFFGLKHIMKRWPDVPVVMLTVFEDDHHVFESICLGAKGYLLKKSSPEKIIEAIHDTVKGGSPMSSSIARKITGAFASIRQAKATDYKLTKKEKDILQSLVDGNSYKMIANELHISINTVRQYIRSIYQKLQVHSMNEAVAKAIKQHVLS